MAKEKITLTIDTEQLAELRRLVGGRSISSSVEAALAEHLKRLRHFQAVDEWLAEMDAKWGLVPPAVQQKAQRIVDEWEAVQRSGSQPPKRNRPRAGSRAS